MPLKLFRRGRIWHMRGTVAGTRIYESTGADRKEQAEQIAAQREAELWKCRLVGPEHAITVAQAIVIYQGQGGETRFTKPILDAWHDKPLASIKPGEVRDLAMQLYPSAGPATWNRQVITPMLAVINCAADRGLASPIRVKRFKEPRVRKEAVTREWIDAFRESASNPYLAALCLFNFTSGARITEAVEIEPDHMSLQDGIAWADDTKNGEPRVYYLIPELVAELANLPPRNGRVFGYRHRWSVYGPWKTTCKRAGIKHVKPHDAGRHSFATELIVRRGVDIPTVARLGNWKSRRLLLETYAHTDKGREIIDREFGAKSVQSDPQTVAKPMKNKG